MPVVPPLPAENEPMEAIPVDYHSARLITYPCYVLRSEDGAALAYQPTSARGAYAVVVLTDEDALNRFRHDLGVPERGAVKFTTPRQLLEGLRALPPQVKGVCFDLARLDKASRLQQVHLLRLDRLREQLAASARG
jgi:hypothetical protein